MSIGAATAGTATASTALVRDSMANSRMADLPMYVMRDVRQVKALRTPARHQVVAAIQHLGRCSVGELAARIGWKAESLYYHVKALCAVGLVVDVDRRKSGRRWESVYQAVAPELTLDRENRSPEYLAAVADTYRAALRAAERGLERALQVEKSGKGPRTDTALYQQHVRLSASAVADVRARIAELCAAIAEDDDPEAEGSFLLTVAWSRVDDGEIP